MADQTPPPIDYFAALRTPTPGSPSGSTPLPPPPPPAATVVTAAVAAPPQPAHDVPTATPAEVTPAEVPTATPAADVAPIAESPADGSSRQRRSLVGGLVAVLVVGLVGALFVMGTDDGTSNDDAAPPADEVALDAAAVTTAAPTTTAAPATTQAPTTTAAPTTTEAPTTTQAAPRFPVLPDGSPEPIVAVFNGATIEVAGWVPSQEKSDQLKALALANSTDPNAVVVGELQIDPMVPLNIGTRVIEMNSPRFGAGSSSVTPEHAAQLDRVAFVMEALPHVTVTVVGHADQVGDEAANYALSEARAVSVVRYLVGKGVAPSRLAARAVGEQDLLSEDNSDVSLALNRRTEFIFYGLVAD